MARKSARPSAKLLRLEKLVGTWRVAGPEVSGEVTFEWLTGGWFLVQRGRVNIWGRKIIFTEFIGYDQKRRVCASHLFNNFGDLFTYDWEIKGGNITIWFGQKGSDNSFKGKFAKNGASYSGAWKWPGGGYEAKMTKLGT